MMRRMWLLWAALAAVVWVGGCGPARQPGGQAEGFFLNGGERIVFFGDSITAQGGYVDYVHAYLLTRFGHQRFEVVNQGQSSETLSGLSEAGHEPPRPNALDRFERDVAALRPDVIVACFGMNDGIYQPFSEERFAAFRAGVEALIEQVRQKTRARLVVLTPPVYDAYRRQVHDAEAADWGYQYPYVGYDEVLRRYSDWLMGLEEPAVMVVDVHGAMVAHLERRRATQASYYVSPDGVHPNATGHGLMAQALLRAWQAPAEAGSVAVDVGGALKQVRTRWGQVEGLAEHGAAVRFVWTVGLPMPMDAVWDAASVEQEQVAEQLSRHRLRAAGLAAERYELWAGDVLVGVFDREALAEGVDLLDQEAFPTVKASGRVLQLVKQMHQASEVERDRLLAEVQRLSVPKPIEIRLLPTDQ